MFCLSIEMEFKKKTGLAGHMFCRFRNGILKNAWAYVLSEHRNGILKKA